MWSCRSRGRYGGRSQLGNRVRLFARTRTNGQQQISFRAPHVASGSRLTSDAAWKPRVFRSSETRSRGSDAVALSSGNAVTVPRTRSVQRARDKVGPKTCRLSCFGRVLFAPVRRYVTRTRNASRSALGTSRVGSNRQPPCARHQWYFHSLRLGEPRGSVLFVRDGQQERFSTFSHPATPSPLTAISRTSNINFDHE